VIEVSRLNGKQYYLNPDLIRSIEATPDTLIALTTGEKVMVKETVETVIGRVMDWRKRTVQEPPSAVPQSGGHA
jgi:flagellar protein FlbD